MSGFSINEVVGPHLLRGAKNDYYPLGVPNKDTSMLIYFGLKCRVVFFPSSFVLQKRNSKKNLII